MELVLNKMLTWLNAAIHLLCTGSSQDSICSGNYKSKLNILVKTMRANDSLKLHEFTCMESCEYTVRDMLECELMSELIGWL